MSAVDTTTTTAATHAAACLRTGHHCNPSAPCDDRRWPRSCLTTHVAAWTSSSSLAHVECCLRCCVRHWVRKLGLEANENHWAARRANFYVSTGAGSLTSDASNAPMPMPRDSILYARFSIARFAHVQAVGLSDWVALTEHAASLAPLHPRFASPHAGRSNGTLIVLNGWGWSQNVSADGARLVHRVGHAGRRYLFDDPLPYLFARLRGRHCVHYGNDHTISGWLMESFYKRRLGEALARYVAPNLDASASRLPYALEAPLGLNSNAWRLDAILRARAAEHTGWAHRSATLLCCCMHPWRHRLRVMRALERNGFACSNATRPWEATVDAYLSHRFVLSIYGNGHNDFRHWEILSAGAVPVVQRLEEQDALFDGLPVVRVADWTTFTPTALEAEGRRVERGVADGTLSWTKVFAPYWLHQHTAHLEPPRTSRGAR